jgi:hypothetical protein
MLTHRLHGIQNGGAKSDVIRSRVSSKSRPQRIPLSCPFLVGSTWRRASTFIERDIVAFLTPRNEDRFPRLSEFTQYFCLGRFALSGGVVYHLPAPLAEVAQR